jgi:predicted AlkP superfamily pyrophosphatase or phosphodiesterase
MPRWRRSATALRCTSIVAALALVVGASSAQRATVRDPILVLVSFDGWRSDYIDRLAAPNLRALAARGVRAAALVPSFPALTFPNHYTLVTGLYPEHHGIVANNMIDESIGSRFSTSAETAKDPRWWDAEPLWVTVIRAGRRAATMFWPGTDVEIRGVRPTFWKPYVKAITSPDRVRQVVEWLRLPDAQRPSFLSVYFDEVDTTGHESGVDSPELRAAAAHLDDAVGQLVRGVHALGLDDRTTIVVVSDHGMTALSTDRVVYLDDYVDPASVEVTEWNGLLAAAPRDGDVQALYRKLHGRHPALAVYLREQLPQRLHYSDNPRIAPLVGIPRIGWAVTTRARLAGRKLEAGAHGFDPRDRDMGALFIAAGPGLRRGVVVPAFDNVDVYNVLCRVLGLTAEKNDGGTAIAARLFEAESASASTRRLPQPRVR